VSKTKNKSHQDNNIWGSMASKIENPWPTSSKSGFEQLLYLSCNVSHHLCSTRIYCF